MREALKRRATRLPIWCSLPLRRPKTPTNSCLSLPPWRHFKSIPAEFCIVCVAFPLKAQTFWERHACTRVPPRLCLWKGSVSRRPYHLSLYQGYWGNSFARRTGTERQRYINQAAVPAHGRLKCWCHHLLWQGTLLRVCEERVNR